MSGEDDFWSDADEEALAQLDCEQSHFELECDKILEKQGTPHQRYRPKYLIVSDLAAQHWCEQKLLYSFSPEVCLLRALPGEKVDLQEKEETQIAKEKGSGIHRARELEVQVPVEITVVTKEDSWAVKFLNLQSAILAFHHGRHVAREVPVFGDPFGDGLFVFGIVDEMKYNPENHSVEISELKTRRSKFPPRFGQQEKDKFQVGVYRQLFNEMVLGKVTKDLVAKHLHLDLSKPLSNEVKAYMQELSHDATSSDSLSGLLDLLLTQVQTVGLIQKSRVEYVYQETGSSIVMVDAEDDADSVHRKYQRMGQWWLGKRGTTGVDIEDCWKCDFCQFSPLCEWRDFMASKLSKK